MASFDYVVFRTSKNLAESAIGERASIRGHNRQHSRRSGGQIDPSKATVRSRTATYRLWPMCDVRPFETDEIWLRKATFDRLAKGGYVAQSGRSGIER
jgi:hypothetical protein